MEKHANSIDLAPSCIYHLRESMPRRRFDAEDGYASTEHAVSCLALEPMLTPYVVKRGRAGGRPPKSSSGRWVQVM